MKLYHLDWECSPQESSNKNFSTKDGTSIQLVGQVGPSHSQTIYVIPVVVGYPQRLKVRKILLQKTQHILDTGLRSFELDLAFIVP